MAEHFEAGENKECAEEKENPVELVHKCGTKPDQNRSEGDNTENTPEQHTVLVKTGDAEEAENRCDNKHVVHRKALLDQITGIKLQTGFRSALPPHPAAESQCDQDIKAVKQQAFPGFDLVFVTMENAKIENEQANHDNDKCRPEIYRCTEKIAR